VTCPGTVAPRLGSPDDDDVTPGVAPLFHAMGLPAVLLGGLSRGATIVTMPRFDFEGFLRAISRTTA
jgi:acyl-CoA synthetase (AMP-forming)/AMP-acid ligase II